MTEEFTFADYMALQDENAQLAAQLHEARQVARHFASGKIHNAPGFFQCLECNKKTPNPKRTAIPKHAKGCIMLIVEGWD